MKKEPIREGSNFNHELLSRNCPSKHDGSELRYWLTGPL
jgi:hypothetical protein